MEFNFARYNKLLVYRFNWDFKRALEIWEFWNCHLQNWIFSRPRRRYLDSFLEFLLIVGSIACLYRASRDFSVDTLIKWDMSLCSFFEFSDFKLSIWRHKQLGILKCTSTQNSICFDQNRAAGGGRVSLRFYHMMLINGVTRGVKNILCLVLWSFFCCFRVECDTTWHDKIKVKKMNWKKEDTGVLFHTK